MAGGTPSGKRRFRRKKPPEAHQGGTGPAPDATASAEDRTAPLPHDAVERGGRGLPAPLETAGQAGSPTRARRLATVRKGVAKSGGSAMTGLTRSGRGARTRLVKSRERARAALGQLADVLIDNAPRVPVRDLQKLRRQFPGLTPEQLADKLVAGAANASSTVGAGVGAAAMMPVPPAMPTELAAEIIGVAAIELKLVAELHEVYGVRPPGGLKDRSTAYLNAWSQERGIEFVRPSTLTASMSGQLRRQLRQQIMKRSVRNLPNLLPFMVGAAVGAVMNRRDTRKLAARIRDDLRRRQVPWDALPALPPLEQPEHPLGPRELPGHDS
ncbi:EcsC family protein [Streptomyces peucetius]|uniref:EcsC family protein n=1 Tax=Streptomyces peucetius TaxID=1950 RepID=A0ABY6ID69_STRPE|nr:EcsC family protein [Streptomyces peucetius]UYQ64923.1 EcsC family protein [Streptomyces peucetius]